MKRQSGFTLTETLIGLAIVSVALIAAHKVSLAMQSGTERQSTTALAQICAENDLVAVSLSSQYPNIGSSETQCNQLGQHFTVLRHVSATANPSFRRVQSQVMLNGKSVISLVTIVGRI